MKWVPVRGVVPGDMLTYFECTRLVVSIEKILGSYKVSYVELRPRSLGYVQLEYIEDFVMMPDAYEKWSDS
jgi:hypothetical protein